MNTNQHEYRRTKNLKSQIVTLGSRKASSLSVILNEVKNLSRSKRAGRGKPVRWVVAPQSSLANVPAVQGVALAPNEDVQWLWTHTANGSYVSGYNIVRSLPKKRQRPFAALRVTNVEKGD